MHDTPIWRIAPQCLINLLSDAFLDFQICIIGGRKLLHKIRLEGEALDIGEGFEEWLDGKTGATAEKIMVELKCSSCERMVVLQRRGWEYPCSYHTGGLVRVIR